MNIRGSVNKLSSSTVVAALAAICLLIAGLYIAKDSSLQRKSSAALASVPGPTSSAPAKRDDAKVLAAYGKLPLSFMENQGQTAQDVRYVSHGSGYDLFLTSQEAVVTLRHGKHPDLSPRHRFQSLKAMHELRRSAPTTTALRMQFEGANPQAQIVGQEKLPGAVNYFVGSDPQKWRRNIPTYAQVKYTQVYPGVDLVFYGNERKLEYDFVVAPGADANVIRLSLSGAKKMRLNSRGDVLLTVPGGEVALQKPLIYQNIDGQRREIAGRYALRGGHVSFAVASYDRREPLIVDPILNYSTYVGGGDDDSTGFGVAVDSAGNAYISGQTFSTDFPTQNPLTPAAGVNAGSASGQGFVTEISASGTVVFSTYLGGSAGGDAAFGIALDPSGNIYVTGETVSIDFPTLNGYKSSPLIANVLGTSFLTKLTSAGALAYSTYIGGTNNDFGNAVAADDSGNAYVTGTTQSSPAAAATPSPTTFPFTTNAAQKTLNNAQGNAFLTRIDTTQSGTASLIYSTYLGGSDDNEASAGFPDEGFGIAVDTGKHAFLGGVSASSDFPVNGTVAAKQPTALNAISSAFVAEIDTTAGTLLYSSYLGGTGGGGFGEFGTGVDIQAGTTKLYITGVTNSPDFPTTLGAYQLTGDNNLGAAFVTITDTSNGTLSYSTYLGAGGTTGWSIKADSTSGSALVGGATDFATLPTTPGAYQTSLAAGAPGDGFIAEIDPAGSGATDLTYLSYFGGSGSGGTPDQIFGIAITALPTVVIAGQTSSTNLPSTTGNMLNGPSDAFVASLNLTAPTLSLSATTLTFSSSAVGTAATGQTLTLTNNSNSPITFTSATAATTTPVATDFSAATTCTVIPALGTCTIMVGYTPSVDTAEAGTLTVIDGAGTQMIALSGSIAVPVPGFTLSATPSGTLTVKKGAAGMVTINVTPVNGFNAAVALTCTGAPKQSTCAIAPASVTPAGGVAATAVLTFTTKSFVAPPVLPRVPTNTIRVVVPVALMLLLVILLASEQRLRTRLTMAAALLIVVALAGCGSSGTTKGPYTLTVTGTSGSITETVSVPVTVD